MKTAVGDSKLRAWRVVIVDDHPMIRDAYRVVIDAQPDLHVVACVADGGALTSILRLGGVDVVLLDYQLHDADDDGVALIQRVHARFPASRIVVCSALDDPLTMRAAFAAGAQGFLSKRQSMADGIKAIRTAVSGKRYCVGHVYARNGVGEGRRWLTQGWLAEGGGAGSGNGGGSDSSGSSSSSNVSGARGGICGDTESREEVRAMLDTTLPAGLSLKEFDVLRCCRQGLTPTTIAVKLKRSVKTVSGHKVAAFEKLGYRNDAQMHKAFPRARDR